MKYWVVEQFIVDTEQPEESPLHKYEFHPFTGVPAEDEEGARKYAEDYYAKHNWNVNPWLGPHMEIGNIYEDPDGDHR